MEFNGLELAIAIHVKEEKMGYENSDVLLTSKGENINRIRRICASSMVAGERVASILVVLRDNVQPTRELALSIIIYTFLRFQLTIASDEDFDVPIEMA